MISRSQMDRCSAFNHGANHDLAELRLAIADAKSHVTQSLAAVADSYAVLGQPERALFPLEALAAIRRKASGLSARFATLERMGALAVLSKEPPPVR